ncbi:MAG: branched-chain amino acid ABC transporter substrate-binding protein, partial [Lutimaribacter sp.]
EGMEHYSLWGGKIMMRPQDHQAIQDVHIFAHTNEGVQFDYDNSGYGMVVESSVAMASADAPTTCKMQRP